MVFSLDFNSEKYSFVLISSENMVFSLNLMQKTPINKDLTCYFGHCRTCHNPPCNDEGVANKINVYNIDQPPLNSLISL